MNKKKLIDSLKIILETDDIELIKLMVESIIEELIESDTDNDVENIN